jgi:hypothetical protein
MPGSGEPCGQESCQGKREANNHARQYLHAAAFRLQ